MIFSQIFGFFFLSLCPFLLSFCPHLSNIVTLTWESKAPRSLLSGKKRGKSRTIDEKIKEEISCPSPLEPGWSDVDRRLHLLDAGDGNRGPLSCQYQWWKMPPSCSLSTFAATPAPNIFTRAPISLSTRRRFLMMYRISFSLSRSFCFLDLSAFLCYILFWWDS